MKNLYKILAIVLFALTTPLNAQLKNVDGTTNDEFLGGDGTILGKSCNCVNEDIPNLNLSFNSLFSNAVANEEAVRKAASRNARDWYENQKEIIKGYINNKYGKNFTNFDEAREHLFKESEHRNININTSRTEQKISQAYSKSRNDRDTGLKALKALQQRENEIRNGILDNSIYSDIKVNNIPLKDLRTLDEVNTQKAIFNSTIVDNLWQSSENLYMRDELRKSYSLFGKIEPSVIQAKNSLYNSKDYWDKINLLQFLIHYEQYKTLASPPYALGGEAAEIFNQFDGKVDIATEDFIENYVRNSYTNYTVFHPEYWRVILRDKYNNSGAMTSIAKAEHQALRDKALINEVRATPMGSSLDVDYIKNKLNITDKDKYEWLNANPDKAKEFASRISKAISLDTQENSEPTPINELTPITGENYYNEVNQINNELIEGAEVVQLMNELSISDNYHKTWIYQNHIEAGNLLKFANLNRINGALTADAQEQIKKAVAIMPSFSGLKDYWPQNEQQWAVVVELFKSVALEIGLSFVPGYDAVDLLKSIDSGDMFGAALALAGLVSTVAGSSVFKGAFKAGTKFYKIMQVLKRIKHFATELGKLIAKGFKTKIIDNVLHLTDDAGNIIAKGDDAIEILTKSSKKLDDLGDQAFEQLRKDPDFIKKFSKVETNVKLNNHTFKGDVTVIGVNAAGENIYKITGIHSNKAFTNGTARIKPGTQIENLGDGFYKAKVEKQIEGFVNDLGTNWKVKSNKSTFFPDSWSITKIQAEITFAFKNKVLVSGNKFEGFTTSGHKITMYLDELGNIKTAFPDL